MPIIKCSSAPSGSGKTHQTVNRVCNSTERDPKAVIAQPTKHLIDKTVADELATRSGCPDHEIFHGDRVGKKQSVSGQLVEYLKVDPAPVLFMTHSLIPIVPYWHNKDAYDLLIDEEFQVVRRFHYTVPETQGLVTDMLDIEPLGPMYGRLFVQDKTRFRKRRRNERGDELIKTFQELFNVFGNEHYETFVNVEQYEKLRSGCGKTLICHSILQPSVVRGFRSVFMTAANFYDTAVYQLWQNVGIEFQEEENFTKALRYSTHPNGHLLKIFYMLETPWSRRAAERCLEDGKTTTLQHMLNSVNTHFKDEPFLYQVNDWVRKEAASQQRQAHNIPFGPSVQILPNKPHGLNTYLDIHNIAFLSSLLPPPDQFKFLEWKGLSGEAVRTITYYNAVYQAVMRTSLRSPEDSNPKQIVVPDQDAALWLARLFPGCQVERLDVGFPDNHCAHKPSGRKRKYDSSNERVAAFRERQKEKQMEIHAELIEAMAQNQIQEGDCNENTIIDYSLFVTGVPYTGTIYEHKAATTPLLYLPWQGDDWFMGFLKGRQSKVCAKKEENLLMSPSVFDPSKSSETSRGLKNIVYVRYIWLDFEDGNLPPEEFAAVFPNIRMLAMNSYNHTKESPRFRIIIPTTDVLTPDAYTLVFDNIERALSEAGYWTRRKSTDQMPESMLRSGLDRSKRPPSSLFYLPCQARDPKVSFFKILNSSGQPIDAVDWVQHSVVKPSVEQQAQIGSTHYVRTVNQEKVQSAINRWHNSTSSPGQGNEMFFQLGVDLRSAGMPLGEIESTLKNEANYGRSPKERSAQIRSIMTTLRTNQRFEGESISGLNLVEQARGKVVL